MGPCALHKLNCAVFKISSLRPPCIHPRAGKGRQVLLVRRLDASRAMFYSLRSRLRRVETAIRFPRVSDVGGLHVVTYYNHTIVTTSMSTCKSSVDAPHTYALSALVPSNEIYVAGA